MRTKVRSSAPPVPPDPGARPLREQLASWVEAGLITPEQAVAIRQHVAGSHERRPTAYVAPPAEPAPPAPTSLVIEALGYLGGVIMVVGAVILVDLVWDDLAVALRLGLVGLTTLALVGAGVAVPDRLGEAAGRLRSVLWALAVVTTGVFFVVLATDVLDRQDEAQLIAVFPPTAAVAAVLWWLRRTWLQQVALLVPLLMSAAAVALELTDTDSSWAGASVWAVATAWSVLAWAGRLEPRVTGVGAGVLGAVIGSLTMDSDVGILLGVLTAVAMVALALWERSLPWLGVAALAMLYTTPRAAEAWFPGRLSAALTLMVTGGLLVGAAVWVARHQAAQRPARR